MNYITSTCIFLLTYFPHAFFMFDYWNFDIGMFVLRSSILLQASKGMFWIIIEREVKVSVVLVANIYLHPLLSAQDVLKAEDYFW